MKNKIKNQNLGLISIKENTKNYSDILPKPHQILLGSLLGDMYCNKDFVNAKIEETHSIKQKEYLLWKNRYLKIFNTILKEVHHPICQSNNKKYIRKPEIRLRSKVSPKLNIYYNLFYTNKKKVIREETLNQMDTLALAVWYCDDGSYDYYDKHIRFHTEGFSYKENLLLRRWLKNKWSINSSFKKAHTGQVGLKLDVKNTNIFLKLVRNHILEMPQSIWHKLGHLWEGNINVLNEAKIKKDMRMKEHRTRDEIKERDRIRSLEYYHKNREKILDYKREYNKSPKYKVYMKEYFKRPEVKERLRKYQKEYRKQTRYKKWSLEYKREYRKRPEVREKIREYNKKMREKKKQGGKN